MYNKILKLVFAVILITQPILTAKEDSRSSGQRLLRKRVLLIQN